MADQPKYSKLVNDANEIGKNLLGFRVSFFDEANFKKFANTEMGPLCQTFEEICISGYFSEGFAKKIIPNLNSLNTKVRIITTEHKKSPNDLKNLASLRKIQDAGAKIRVNIRTHFRMFLCRSATQGLLILGSFDFNKEGMNEERRDAGIHTCHPDLVKSAYDYFNSVWNDVRDCVPLDEKYPDERKKTTDTSPLPKMTATKCKECGQGMQASDVRCPKCGALSPNVG